jgi:sucrose-6-phosphate hydrolase SacC (GH32 family)
LPDTHLEYREKYRPLFHFTTKSGWINDPNGLFNYDGKYHMFYQYNPVGIQWGNMHWGHAVSEDLIHWEEKDVALFPDELGTMFSGSAIVDVHNVSGLKENSYNPILLYYTAAGGTSMLSQGKQFTQCLAYSTDGGSIFKKYDKNPLIPNIDEGNRDPKISFHAESGNYVIALYMTGNDYALFSSKDLLNWNFIQRISLDDDWECPDFYPILLDNDPSCVKWLLTGASDRYIVGSFDGFQFKPETSVKKLQYSSKSYASQTWANICESDGRRIRIAWNRFEIPGMPFNNSMTFPCKISLKSYIEDIFLCVYPVEEIEKLYKNSYREISVKVSALCEYSKILSEMAYDVKLVFVNDRKSSVRISVFGLDIHMDFSQNEIVCAGDTAPMIAVKGFTDIRLLIDVNATEIFINDGKAFMCVGHLQDYNLNKFSIMTTQDDIEVSSLEIAELRSIW